jgi:hypothetical protein
MTSGHFDSALYCFYSLQIQWFRQFWSVFWKVRLTIFIVNDLLLSSYAHLIFF